jgi:hypothetical protein
MKLLYLALVCALLSACNEPASEPAPRRNGTIDESVLNILLSHYGVDRNNPAWTIARDSSYLSAEFRNPELLMPDEEFSESEVEAYSFPLSEEEYLFGDLNADGRDEIVLYQQVMGAAGPAMLDIFIFEGTPGQYRLLFHTPAFAVSSCETGAFQPVAIINGEITGTAKCFADSDPRCCPSLVFSMRLKWNGKSLELIEKTAMNIEQ